MLCILLFGGACCLGSWLFACCLVFCLRVCFRTVCIPGFCSLVSVYGFDCGFAVFTWLAWGFSLFGNLVC